MEKKFSTKPEANNSPCDSATFQRVANRVSFISILANTVLSVFKLLAGIFAHSGAMISDAIHSASDVFSTFIVLIGVKLSAKDSDKEHPYGHERIECVAAIVLAVVLLITGLAIGKTAVENIIHGNYSQLEVPGVLALAAAFISIVTKEAMFRYTKINAKRIDSTSLMADAWHHRSDAFSSVGALIGIGGARLGFPILDSVASLAICFFITKASYDIFTDAIGKMVDRSCDESTEKALYNCVIAEEGVLSVDFLHTRIFGNKIYVDVEIGADGNDSLNDTHKIAERVHDSIEKHFPKVKHIMVHVNPVNNPRKNAV